MRIFVMPQDGWVVPVQHLGVPEPHARPDHARAASVADERAASASSLNRRFPVGS